LSELQHAPRNLNALKSMNIARRNVGENGVGIVQPGSNNSTGNGLGSFRMKIRANLAKSTDVKVGRRADVGNATIKIEMIVKSDAQEFDLVC